MDRIDFNSPTEKRYGRVRETSWTKVTAIGAVRCTVPKKELALHLAMVKYTLLASFGSKCPAVRAQSGKKRKTRLCFNSIDTVLY
jgi:hypothetical protein